MAYADQEMSGSRIVSIVIVALIHLVIGYLLVTGLASVVAFHVLYNSAMVIGLVPITGIPLPFLSYGGSSLVANWVIVALLLRVSDQARRPAPRLEPADDSGADSESTQVVKLR